LIDTAHRRLTAPIIVIWDNLNVHVSARMRALVAARSWLTVVQLPAYAPDLNPVEGMWSHLKRSLGNLAVRGLNQLRQIIRGRLRAISRRLDLPAGFLAQTGMDVEPEIGRPP
jgi:transposase